MRLGLAAVVALGVAACATPSSQSPARASLGQIFSSEAAVRHALGDLCLASSAAGTPVASLAASPRAMTIEPVRNGGLATDQAWYAGAGVYLFAHAEGGCLVRATGGDAATLGRTAETLLAQAGLAPGRRGPGGGGRMDRSMHCRVDARPTFALLSVARAGARGTPPVQVSVGRLTDVGEENCRPSGPYVRGSRAFDPQ